MIIVIKIISVLARPWAKYLDRRPHRATLILSNLNFKNMQTTIYIYRSCCTCEQQSPLKEYAASSNCNSNNQIGQRNDNTCEAL